MTYIIDMLFVILATIKDVAPIIFIIFGFQYVIIKKPIANLKKIIIGLIYVILGLSFFLIGLEKALFPLGKLMAQQLTDPDFIRSSMHTVTDVLSWDDYFWVYIFAAAIGFSTTIAEPSLIAVAIKANDVSGGGIGTWGLRISVAIGVSVGITLGAFRIVTGTPLHYYMIVGYIIVILQTFYAPKMIIGLAYDSGGVTTSTVTVPLVAALGLGLASTIPGRSTLLDGFGLIAFASLFPIMSVMFYAQISEFLSRRKQQTSRESDTGDK